MQLDPGNAANLLVAAGRAPRGTAPFERKGN